jgi:hypothetical protein
LGEHKNTFLNSTIKQDKIMSNVKYLKQILGVLFLLPLFLPSCLKNSDNSYKLKSNTPKLIAFSEINDLIYFKGNESSKIVLINTQGGPAPKLLKEEFVEMFAEANLGDTLLVNVHQAQTKKTKFFTSKEITFAQAIKYDAESIDMLYKVVKYFKDKGRTVYVLGISFGAFITQELITKKGIDVADKYVIMVGRLNMPDEFWKWFSEGNNGKFKDGITPVKKMTSGIGSKNMHRLAAGLGKNRYIELLNKYDDLSKITYVYGKIDEQVGRLIDTEIDFLISKNATVVAKDGGHSDTWESYVTQELANTLGIQ